MTTLDSLKNPLTRVITFAKVYYIDPDDEALKYYLFANNYKKFSNGDVPETRLDDVPFFKKEIDPINNEIIIQSAYKVKLNNSDGVLTDFFKDKIFNNQKVEFYVTTEDATDEIIVATAIYDTVVIADDIELNLKEVSSFTKKNSLNRFTAYSNDADARLAEYADEYDRETDDNDLKVKDGLDPELTNKTKQIILGKGKVSPTAVNAALDSEVWTPTRVYGYIARKDNFFQLFVGCFPDLVTSSPTGDYLAAHRDAAVFQRLRKIVKDGDELTLAGYENYKFKVAGSLWGSGTGFARVSPYTTFERRYINLELVEGWERNGSNAGSEFPENLFGEVVVKAAGIFLNDEYLVTDLCNKTYEETTLVGCKGLTQKEVFKNSSSAPSQTAMNKHYGVHEYGTNQNFLTIGEDWWWLEAGDRVSVHFKNTDGGDIELVEEFEVESFDSTTKKIWFKEPDSLSLPMLQKWKDLQDNPEDTNLTFVVRFEKIQKIKVDGAIIPLKRSFVDIPSKQQNGKEFPSKAPFLMFPSFNNLDGSHPVIYDGVNNDNFMGLSGLKCFVKKNFYQHFFFPEAVQLSYEAQLGLGPDLGSGTHPNVQVPTDNYGWNTYHMYYALDDYDDYVSGPKVKAEFVYDPNSTFKTKFTGAEKSKSFWRIRIAEGATVDDLMTAAVNYVNTADANFPFYFTYTGSSSDALPSLHETYTSLSGHSSTKIFVNLTTYNALSIGQTIKIRQSGNFTNRTITNKVTDTGPTYAIEFSSVPFTPSNGVGLSTIFAPTETDKVFPVPPYFSLDANSQHALAAPLNKYDEEEDDDARSQKYLVGGKTKADKANTSAHTDFFLESEADKLVRDQNKKSKVVFGWWYHSYFDPTSNPELVANVFAANQSELYDKFGDLEKVNYDVDSRAFARLLERFGTIVNMCPFTCGFTVATDWFGSDESLPTGMEDPNGAVGWVSGTTSFEQKMAITQAVANKINQQILYWQEDGETPWAVPLNLVAVAITDGTNFWVRIKHTTFNNCSSNADNLIGGPLARQTEHACAFRPFIRNNALYIKLDRAALAIAVANAKQETLLNVQYPGLVGATNLDYGETDAYYNTPSQNVISGVAESDTDANQTSKNPDVPARRYAGRNSAMLFNFVAPKNQSLVPGEAGQWKIAWEPELFGVVRTNSPIFPSLDQVIVEKLPNAYTSPGDSKVEADAEFQLLSVDNHYQKTPWNEWDRPTQFAKKSVRTFSGFAVDPDGGAIGVWYPILGNNFYPFVEADPEVYFKDKNCEVSEILTKLFEIYNLQILSPSALAALKELGLTSFLVLDKNQELYKSLNTFLSANNLVCYVDPNGLVVIEKIKLVADSAPLTITNFDCQSIASKTEMPTFTSVQLKFNQDGDKFDQQIIENEDKKEIFADNGIDNPKIIEANILVPVTDPEDQQILVQKFTEQNEYLDIIVSMEYINLEINNLFKFRFADASEGIFCVVKKETNFNSIKLRAVRCIPPLEE